MDGRLQGRLRGGTLRNRGTVTLAQGASTFESKLINDSGSRFEVADGSATFSTSPFDFDSVDNLGSFTVRNATVSFDKRLRIAASGYLVGGAGAVFEVETSLDRSSLQATQWDAA